MDDDVAPERAPERPLRDGAGARQASLRAHNLALALRQVLEAPEPTTRARIATASGLTRATVSDLVERLIAAGLVQELRPQASTGAGRPGMLLAPAAATVVGLGLEIQVDHLSVRATDLTGSCLEDERAEVDLRDSDPVAVAGALARLAGPVIERLTRRGIAVAGACVSIPAVLRAGAGPVRLAPNLGWRDVDLVALLERRPELAGIRCEIGNDADLAARAETRTRAGAGHPAQSFFLVSGEVGIGGAIVVDGRLSTGQHGWSGEIGHVVIDRSGPVCGCGAHGCLEAYAGLDVIVRAAGLPVATGVPALLEQAERPGAALRSLEAAADAIGTAAATALNLVDVERVVLGGVYADLFDHLAPRVRRVVGERVLAARWSEVAVERSLAGPEAAVTGAGLRVLDRIIDHPAAWIESHPAGPAQPPATVGVRSG